MNSALSNTIMSIPIVPTTGGQERNVHNPRFSTGVALGVVLTVVTLVVVVVIVLVVRSVRRRRRKFDLGCNGTYEVPYDASVG